MMKKEKWKIGKEFHFEFGHMVHSQSLNPEYSVDSKCVCRHPHGHSGRVVVMLEGTSLDERGYFCDFKELNWFKKFIDDVLDHKMIIDVNDPGLEYILPGGWDDELRIGDSVSAGLIEKPQGYSIINPNLYMNKPERYQEICEGFVFVNFVPTSENLSKWFQQIVDEKMSKIGVRCPQVQFCETSKSQCNYYLQ